MAKVGVITFHHSVNYGALLQTYALQTVLKELGYEPEVINYHRNEGVYYNSSKLKKGISFSWNKLLRPMIGGNLRRKRSKQFQNDYFVFSKEFNCKDELILSPPIYDAYITGSDQVWNPYITGGDTSYLLDFAPNKTNKISYGASFGIEYIPQDFVHEFTKYLNNLDFISVRETNAKSLIGSLGINKNIEVVLDPTLLLNSNTWEKITSKNKVNRKYILCYFMPGDKEICSSIESIASALSDETGLEIINIGKKEYSKFKFWENNQIEDGPIEFLELFKNAEYIITNSFHGTAFSIIFEKQFYVPFIANSNKAMRLNSRIISLLTLLNLRNQLISTTEIDEKIISELDGIDYDSVNKHLNFERKKSLEYLKNSLLNNKC